MPLSAEVFVWPEGEILLSTGSAATYAVARAGQSRHQAFYGWLQTGPSMSGVYTDHLTGKRADASIGAGYTFDKTLIAMAEAATAVHMEFRQTDANGSAGWKFFSGRIDAFAVQGSNGGQYSFSMNYHSNLWSAYGGTL